jgi:hypothetical protein
MAAVDPDDDGIQRYVVRRYAYDPKRHERRHQVVAAFDDEAEFSGLIELLNRDLQRRRAAGDPVDRQEHYTGVLLEPGHRRRQQDGRLVKKAFLHRVAIPDALLEQFDLPPNVSFGRYLARRVCLIATVESLRPTGYSLEPTALV